MIETVAGSSSGHSLFESDSNLSVNDDPRLVEIHRFLNQSPEFRALAKGVTFCINPWGFGAYCDFNRRVIVLDPQLFERGTLSPNGIQSILFELANASQSEEFQSLIERAKQYTPDDFVKEFERIEHKSALVAKRALRRLFTVSEWKKCPLAFNTDNFDLHYLIQQAAGHSLDIWHRFAHLFPSNSKYHGTWSSPIREEDKKYVFALLDLTTRKGDENHFVQREAAQDYQRLQALLRDLGKDRSLAPHLRDVKQAVDGPFSSAEQTARSTVLDSNPLKP